jgi:septal ring factor EnvC (AmiA/AmiB activator)
VSPARRAAVLVLLFGASLLAQQAPAHRDRDLERVRGEIRKLRDRLTGLQSRARTAEEELEALELQLGIETRELDLAMEAERTLESQRTSISGQIVTLTSRIGREKRYLATRLAALYRLGPLTYLRLVASIDTRQNPFQAASMLTYLVTRDARAVSSFQRTRERLSIEQAVLDEKTRQISAAKAIVGVRQEQLARTRRQKEAMLVKLQSEESTTTRRLAELEEKARRLENLVTLLYGRVDPGAGRATRIESYQGALLWPVRGKLLETFGRHRDRKFATVTATNGLKIEAAEGAEVRSVFEGTVLFSQWFKGYGNLIIVDHGNRVFSLYGNTRSPRIAVGDRISTQQVIASVAANEESTSGYLYFEMREDNKPVDPQRWLR